MIPYVRSKMLRKYIFLPIYMGISIHSFASNEYQPLTNQQLDDIVNRHRIQGIHYLAFINASAAIEAQLLADPERFNITDAYGNNVLHYAAFYNRKESIVSIMKFNVDVNFRNDFGETPLMHAVNQKCGSSIIKLIQNHASIHAKDNNEVTPWMKATDLQREIMTETEVIQSKQRHKRKRNEFMD